MAWSVVQWGKEFKERKNLYMGGVCLLTSTSNG